jgi:trk system potassium uptake protein TrkA
MRIVVLGGGTVGTSVADLLCRNRHSVTVVERDPLNARRINDDLDVRVINGSASESSVLFQADVIGADLCLAVTGVDEVNLVGASMAKAMGTRRSVARVYAPIFRDLSTFDYQRHFRVDRLLSMEHLSAIAMARGIRSPGSVVIENFARGELEVQELEIEKKTKAVGVHLADLALPSGVRVGSIYREGKMWIPTAAHTIKVGDRITLFGVRGDIDDVKVMFKHRPDPKQGVVIAGGGETGYHLAQTLEGQRFSVTLMEECPERCEFLASHLKHTTVVQANATRRVVLEEERVDSADIFAACLGDDEENIMACVEAHEIGAKSIMAIVQRPDYANVVGKLGIDLVVSPREVIAKQVLAFLNTGAVVSRSLLPGGSIYVLEIEVLSGAAATREVLAELELPDQCLIAAVMTADYVRVPGAADRLQAGDTVVALVDSSATDDLLKLFTPE